MFVGLSIGGWKRSHFSDAVRLRVGLLSFTWNQYFKILKEGPFPGILSLDFLRRSQMRVELRSKTYSFSFAPTRVGSFSPEGSENGEEPFLQFLCAEAINITNIAPAQQKELERDALLAEFRSLFSSSLGTAK